MSALGFMFSWWLIGAFAMSLAAWLDCKDGGELKVKDVVAAIMWACAGPIVLAIVLIILIGTIDWSPIIKPFKKFMNMKVIGPDRSKKQPQQKKPKTKEVTLKSNLLDN